MVKMCFCLTGCVDGCRHRLPDTQRQYKQISEITHKEYQVLETTPHCACSDERAKFRAEIYQAAEEAVIKAESKCKTLRGRLRAHERVWKQITKPWVQGPCPFFEPG